MENAHNKMTKRSGLLVARQISNNEICGRTGASGRKTCAGMRENDNSNGVNRKQRKALAIPRRNSSAMAEFSFKLQNY